MRGPQKAAICNPTIRCHQIFHILKIVFIVFFYLGHSLHLERENTVLWVFLPPPGLLTEQISVHQRHQVPQDPEQKPGPCERGCEQEELVAPLHFQERGPEVTHVEGAAPADVLNPHVAAAIFGQDSPPLPQSAAPAQYPPTQQGF